MEKTINIQSTSLKNIENKFNSAYFEAMFCSLSISDDKFTVKQAIPSSSSSSASTMSSMEVGNRKLNIQRRRRLAYPIRRLPLPKGSSDSYKRRAEKIAKADVAKITTFSIRSYMKEEMNGASSTPGWFNG